MRFNGIILVAAVALAFGAGCVGCESTPKDQPAKDDGGKMAASSGANQSNTRVKAATAEPEPPFVDTPYFDRQGYKTLLKDDRLWVFEAGSENYLSFRSGNEPAKNVTLPRAGPAGLSLRGLDTETLNGYLAARPGFVTRIVDGRIWVFRPGSDALREFEKTGEPAKHVIRPSAGPRRAPRHDAEGSGRRGHPRLPGGLLRLPHLRRRR